MLAVLDLYEYRGNAGQEIFELIIHLDDLWMEKHAHYADSDRTTESEARS